MKKLPIILLMIHLIIVCLLPMKCMADDVFYVDTDSPISLMIEVLPWDIANQIIPNGKIFTVIDVETGLQFKVQRRAGKNHADVQPLSLEDTKIMKKIYNGRWSWNRRAIITFVDGEMIAASMHGMPHGAGAIKNGFPGHFCIHFLGSTTHRSGKIDTIHTLMILKAGGKIEDYLNELDPYELIKIFATAVNIHDKEILTHTIAKTETQLKLTTILNELTYLGITHMSFLPVEDLNEQILVEIPVEVEFNLANKGKGKKDINFVIRRDSLIDRWYIDGQSFIKEF
ncbi:hypothetical protein ACLM5H_18180 [Fredinandcohnia humi]